MVLLGLVVASAFCRPGRRSEPGQRNVNRQVEFGVPSLDDQRRGKVATASRNNRSNIGVHLKRICGVVYDVQRAAVHVKRDAFGTLQLRGSALNRAYLRALEKERVDIEREIKRLEELMGGLENLSKEPDFLVMINANLHITAVREARIKKIPIIALSNLDKIFP